MSMRSNRAVLVMVALPAALACAGRAPAAPITAQVAEPACEARNSATFRIDRPSPLDSTSLTVGGQRVKVCYSRPSMRGRVIFGQLVEHGKPWRTGANEATMLYAADSLEVAGVRLAPGRYILTTVPEREQWTVVVNTTTETEPSRMLQALTEVGRGTVPVRPLAESVEQFTIRGEPAGAGAARLLLEWERTQVAIPLRDLRASR